MSRKHNLAKNEKSQDKSLIYVAIIGVVGTILAAIIGGIFSIINTRTQILLPLSLTQTLLPTKTSIPEYASTPGFCGNGTIPAVTPSPNDSKPNLVIVTVDKGVTWLTLENVLVSLDNSLQMGDRVVILVDGKQNYSDAVIADGKVTDFYEKPALPSSPTPYPTTTPTQVQNPITVLQKQIATTTAQAAMIQATQVAETYLCSSYQWNYSYQTIYSKWQQENVSEFMASLREKIQGFDFNNPSPIESEGLIIASNIFDTDCHDGEYVKCIFIPLTIMQEWRNQPSDIKADFSNVEIVGTMTDCSLYDSVCREKVKYWQDFFIRRNAKSVQFVNLDEFWILLVNMINQ